MAGNSSDLTHIIRCEAKPAKCFVFQTAEDGEEGRFLPSGVDQDGLGGPGEISEPHACWSRSLRTGGRHGHDPGTLNSLSHFRFVLPQTPS